MEDNQEQALTCGNMIVLWHYFLEVLALPKEILDQVMYFLLGDQLITAQDCAAQDQCAVDCLDDVADHLTSHAVVSGVIHVHINKMISTFYNSQGGTNKDTVSLPTM